MTDAGVAGHGDNGAAPGDGSTPVLSARGVNRSFREGSTTLDVLIGVQLQVARGERLAIIGASGSGKTTLLQILGGLDQPDAGVVEVAGRDIHALSERERSTLRNRSIGFVYQFHHLLPEFSAEENIVLPQMIAGLSRAEAGSRARELLAFLGLDARAHHRPAELSGGEQQRVAIARALANAPRVLLADEPTGNLDPKTADHVFSTLVSLVKASRVAALIATHNMEIAARMDRRVTIREGRVVEG
jgi:lipoprotein-releasing system ATP-binding protein